MKKMSFSRLETDQELFARASVVAGHVVTKACCLGALTMANVDTIAEHHGATRRIIRQE